MRSATGKCSVSGDRSQDPKQLELRFCDLLTESGAQRIELVVSQKEGDAAWADGEDSSRHETSMTHLSDEARKERLRNLMRLCYRRLEGTVSEDRLAQELGFVDGAGAPSAQVMYERLQEEWGLPDWVVYPDGVSKDIDKGKKRKTSNTEETPERKAPNTEKTTERKVRDTEDATEELPSPEGAMELFDKDIERLQYYLSELPKLVEWRQGKRFLSSLWIEDDVEDYLDPRDYSEAEWKEICKAYGLDPNIAPVNLVKVAAPHHSPQGFGPTVYKKLEVLINVHALIHGSVDRLLEVLHPRPDEAVREKLYEKRDHKKSKGKDGPVPTLLTAAKQIGQAVRGVTARGKPPPRLSRDELWIRVRA